MRGCARALRFSECENARTIGVCDWSKEISDGLGVPVIWWQIPFAVPSDTPGGEPGAYRDNRVRYIFGHIQQLIDAGGLAAVFGVGAGNQTCITTDGGQFRDAVTEYFANPVPAPARCPAGNAT